MTEMTSYEPGTPSWIDVTSPDVEKAAAFYESLFGWTTDDAGDPEETGGYRMFRKNGKFVAGLMSLMDESQPPVWTTYVTVEDADATTSTAEQAGAQILANPMDVMTAGRMAVLMDPEGAVFAIWQPREHIGAELVNEPGTLTWNELRSRDPEKAKTFYREVFGWHGLGSEMVPGYTIWTIQPADPPEKGVGGMLDMAGTDMPAELPPHWDVTFAVEDADAAATRCQELGGNMLAGPIDLPIGRLYALQDPTGAMFTAMRFEQPA